MCDSDFKQCASEYVLQRKDQYFGNAGKLTKTLWILVAQRKHSEYMVTKLQSFEVAKALQMYRMLNEHYDKTAIVPITCSYQTK
jgi:uncharacterized protein with ACT and thioredoxin-like domain